MQYPSISKTKLFFIRAIDKITFFLPRKNIFYFWKSGNGFPEFFIFQLSVNGMAKHGWDYVCPTTCIDLDNREKGSVYQVFRKRVGRFEFRAYYKNMNNETMKIIDSMQKLINEFKESSKKTDAKESKLSIDSIKDKSDLDTYIQNLINEG